MTRAGCCISFNFYSLASPAKGKKMPWRRRRRRRLLYQDIPSCETLCALLSSPSLSRVRSVKENATKEISPRRMGEISLRRRRIRSPSPPRDRKNHFDRAWRIMKHFQFRRIPAESLLSKDALFVPSSPYFFAHGARIIEKIQSAVVKGRRGGRATCIGDARYVENRRPKIPVKNY